MGSWNIGKDKALEWIKANFKEGDTCLDVGACNGKWSELLGGYLIMDACEAWSANVRKNNLAEKYRRVYITEIQNLRYDFYDLIIFGDVIEHMTVKDAQEVICYALPRCKDLIVAVPYLYPQGERDGNPYEVHKQADLTPRVFEERYPGLEPIYMTPRYGYYTKRGKI